MKLEDHPTVQRIRLKTMPSVPPKKQSLDAAWLKQLVLDAGADDVGFVEIGRPQRQGLCSTGMDCYPSRLASISTVRTSLTLLKPIPVGPPPGR